jgi:hypothetical protein
MKEVPVNEHNIVIADATAEKIEAVDAGNYQSCILFFFAKNSKK